MSKRVCVCVEASTEKMRHNVSVDISQRMETRLVCLRRRKHDGTADIVTARTTERYREHKGMETV